MYTGERNGTFGIRLGLFFRTYQSVDDHRGKPFFTVQPLVRSRPSGSRNYGRAPALLLLFARCRQIQRRIVIFSSPYVFVATSNRICVDPREMVRSTYARVETNTNRSVRRIPEIYSRQLSILFGQYRRVVRVRAPVNRCLFPERYAGSSLFYSANETVARRPFQRRMLTGKLS